MSHQLLESTKREWLRDSVGFVLSLCTLLLLFGCAGTAADARSSSAAEDVPPNIVFIMVDDLGKEWIGAYGAENIKTPSIDALAASGMLFDSVYSMPQCTPTRATLLTGQYPFRHGWVNHWDVPRWGHGCHFDPEQNPSIGRILKSAGYNTCVAGKWQINDFRVQPTVLNDLGFDQYCMWTGFETGVPASAQRYWNAYLHTRSGSRTYADQFGPDVCNQFVLDFLGRQSGDTPFFVYYPMILTHGPLTTTPDRPDARGDERHTAMVEYMDTLVGRVVDKLDETGLRQQTIVVWTTDNGTSGKFSNRRNGRLERGAKGRTSETGTCVPFVVNCPGRVPHRATDALVDFSDLLPTFADLASATLPSEYEFDGKSFAALLLGDSADSPRQWIMAMGGAAGMYDESGRVVNRFAYRDRVVRDKRYKLYVEHDRKPSKLIDLQQDPAEKINRLDDPSLSNVVARLMEVAARFPERDASPRHRRLADQPWDLVQKKRGRR